MNSEEKFRELTTKFLFINCNDVNNCTNYVEELNGMLNEFIGLDYRKGIIVDTNAAIRLMESFANISPKEDTLVVKACCLIVSLVSRQKITIPASPLRRIIRWLLECIKKHYDEIICDVLGVLRVLVKGNIEHLREFYEPFIFPGGLLVKLLQNPEFNQNSYDASTPDEIQMSALLCLEVFLSSIADIVNPDLPPECTSTIGNVIIKLIYDLKPKTLDDDYFALMHTSALHILRHIISVDRQWAGQNVGVILGAALSLMAFPKVETDQSIEEWRPPHPVPVSQQAISEPPPSQNIGTNKGGKVAKMRKPRTNGNSTVGKKNDNRTHSSDRFAVESNTTADSGLAAFYRTIESEFYEFDMKKWRNDFHKKSKMRLAAISVITQMGKAVETRILFGYWHALFPTDESSDIMDLMNCALGDSNERCRMAALQATSVILYGSKPFLSQASNLKTTASFTPFSMTLANMITRMFHKLSEALARERSLLVVTQILKCLTVLIQGTPFHRLKPGIIDEAITNVRRLVYHKDPIIIVAALKVMDFLICIPEMTKDIADCCGVDFPYEVNAPSTVYRNRLDDMIGVFNEMEEEAEEKDDYQQMQDAGDIVVSGETTEQLATGDAANIPWLLRVVLEYLGVNSNGEKDSKPPVMLHIRVEALQLLSSLGKEFTLVRDNAAAIAKALELAFCDIQQEIRLFAARCLDHIAYTMNMALMSPKYLGPSVQKCLQFWIAVLPSLTAQLQDPKMNSVLKASCCDCLSNICVRVYEKLPRDKQMHLISLLNGCACNGENSVRASAVRALAMFVFFPSLREDMCFVENTADAIINLLKEANVYVRIKASWSLGNFTDAFIAAEDRANKENAYYTLPSSYEKINDDLLKRLLEVSIAITSENDKVKCNAVRSIGNLLRLIEKRHMQNDEWQAVCMNAIGKLEHTTTVGNNMKAKWNACYAIGNLFKNEAMYTDSKSFNWSKSVFSTLCELVVRSPNYKVRINAATALCQTAARFENSEGEFAPRLLYGASYMPIWEAMFEALEQAENLTDFNEYKHRDVLVDQICTCIAWFLGMATQDDICQLQECLTPYLDLVKRNWDRSNNRGTSEKSNLFVSQVRKLSEIKKDRFSMDQLQSLKILMDTFELRSDKLGFTTE